MGSVYTANAINEGNASVSGIIKGGKEVKE
jgi:hypothetical protein